ncbi:MAG: phosphoribosylformylglycinamidine cyclo-ligase [Thermoplasmata archaeon]
MARSSTSAWTYASSGVDRGAIASALAALLSGIRYRAPPTAGRLLPARGHFAGLVRVGAETLALTTDTVGTKVALAEAVGRFEEVGQDVVGVNVNDLAAVGARPVGLLDTIVCRHVDVGILRALGRGLDRGLRRAGCHLLGGETAVVGDQVAGWDLGGTAIGYFPKRRRPILGRALRPGDHLIGLPSSGFHANGYTLVRRLLAERAVDLNAPRPGGRSPVARELLRPTRIYSAVVDQVADEPTLHGLAHLSGGGVRNLIRLHDARAFVLDRWPRPPGLFGWIQELGGLDDREVFQTFNMGIGFVLAVARGHADDWIARLARAGARDARVIGRVTEGSGVTIPDRHLAFEGYS